MNFRSSGRPRIYDSASIKLEAFRKRQESAGYLRKEVLVTKETWAQIRALATANEVGTVDAASGLLEHGLNIFTTPQVSLQPLLSAPPKKQPKASALWPTQENNIDALLEGRSAVSPVVRVNPITQFFAKRKEIPNVHTSPKTTKRSADK